MDQPTEEVTAAQPTNGRCGPQSGTRRRHGRRVAKAAVWTVPVVVLDIGPQDPGKLPAADDEQLVEAFPADVPTQRSA